MKSSGRDYPDFVRRMDKAVGIDRNFSYLAFPSLWGDQKGKIQDITAGWYYALGQGSKEPGEFPTSPSRMGRESWKNIMLSSFTQRADPPWWGPGWGPTVGISPQSQYTKQDVAGLHMLDIIMNSAIHDIKNNNLLQTTEYDTLKHGDNPFINHQLQWIEGHLEGCEDCIENYKNHPTLLEFNVLPHLLGEKKKKQD